MSGAVDAGPALRHWPFPAGAKLAAARGGHINASFLVSPPDEPPRWLLQRVNRTVFSDPEQVMRNILVVLDAPRTGIALPSLVPTDSGRLWAVDDDGEVWRCWLLVPGAQTITEPGGPADAREAARAFGAFARVGAGIDATRLGETIAGFHDTPARLATLQRVIGRDPCGRAGSARAEIADVLARSELASVLTGPLASGTIPLRVVHNDAKIANVLFDAEGRATTVIDLDTVMPGTLLYDFGDLVRSCTSRETEDGQAEQVAADAELYAALVTGYLEGAGDRLVPEERALLEPAGRLITWEQAVRFLTDYLAGDTYFATTRPDQNLDRTRTQLALLRSLERQQSTFVRIAQGS